jgi:tetratricopeptide (TPR) repeat protein
MLPGAETGVRPENERRFAQHLASRGLARTDHLRALLEASARPRRGARRPTLLRSLCEKGLLDRERAVAALAEVRASRATERRRERDALPPVADSAVASAPHETAPLPPPSGPVGSGIAQSLRVSASDQGAMLGPYRLLSELGRGSNAIVYRAYDTRLRREVALKTLPGVAGAETLERFRREARAVARVRHPGIVSLYGAEVLDGTLVLALELVTGGSLRSRLADRGPLAEREAAALVRDLALAVAAAHKDGIVHRDIKPANVLLDADGRPRLADFGLAQDVDATELTGTGDVLGTPAYMSPEQARGHSDAVGPSSDIYALGAVLYEALSGRVPFTGRTAMEVVTKVLTEEPESPSDVSEAAGRAPLAADLVAICLQAIEKSPARRYPTAEALAHDLGRFLSGEPIDARPALDRARRWSRRHRRPVLAVSAIAFLALAVAIVVVARAVARERRKREVETILAEAVAERSEKSRGERCVFDLVRRSGPETVLVLGETLDGLTTDLRAATRETLLAAKKPLDPDEEARQFRLEGLEGAVAKLDALAPGAALDRGATVVLGLVRERLEARIAKNSAPDHRPTYREILARAQRDRLGEERLFRGSVAAEALGRIGIVEGALGPLARYVFAEEDEDRAVPAAQALARLRSADALRLCFRAIDRFGKQSRFTAKLSLDQASIASLLDAHTALEHYERGVAYLDTGKTDEAIADFTRAIALDPKGASAHDGRASAWVAKGDRERALADFSRAIDLEPRSSRRWTDRASTRALFDDADGALEDANQAIALDPGDAQAWSTRSWARRRKDPDAAIADARKAIELDPTLAQAWVNLGGARSDKGEHEGAIEDLSRAIQIDPRSEAAWTTRGQAREAQGDAAAAIADYSRSLELDPRLPATWIARGSLRSLKGDTAGAIADLSKAIELSPRLAKAWENRGEARFRAKLEGAIDDLTRAIELEPGLVAAWVNRGYARHESGDREGAIADLGRAIELDDTCAGAWARRGLARSASDPEGATADFTRAIELDKRCADAWHGRGVIKNRLGQWEGAILDFSGEIEAVPTREGAWAARGCARIGRGDLEGAIKDLTKAIDLSPGFGNALAFRGRAHAMAGENALAIRDLERAIEVEPDSRDVAGWRAFLEALRSKP